MSGADAIRRYLADTGWTARELAGRAGIHESNLSRVLSDDPKKRRPAGKLVSILLENATRAAYEAGDTSVPPLRLRLQQSTAQAA